MATKKHKNLTPQQLGLIEALLTNEGITLTDAARKAGFSSKNPCSAATKAMSLPHVKAYYEAELAKRAKRTGVDADYVLKRLAAMETMDIGDIYDENSQLLPIKQWPLLWRQMVKEVDMKTGKVKLHDKLHTIKLMGSHIGVRAFAELLEVTDNSGLGARMELARRRKKAAEASE